MHRGIVFVDDAIGDVDGQVAAIRHRIPGVHAQVEEDLVNLGGIAQNHPGVAGDGELQPNVFRESIANNALNVLQQMRGLDLDSFAFQATCEWSDLRKSTQLKS
jgi:hypothetical protein